MEGTTRKVFQIEEVDDGSDNVMMVVWELWVGGEMSHTYEQYYSKDSFVQFSLDIGAPAYNYRSRFFRGELAYG